ncbi:MAG: hypothetical protein LBV30_00860 [Propionibacteriaceae bacterium]|jgi:hypothetical protein|nr:hypothetical protein [Propionibacteriaceae bacterium]
MTLSQIEYSGIIGDDSFSASSAFDQASLAVTLHFSDRSQWIFHWQVSGRNERLLMTDIPDCVIMDKSLTVSVDASNRWGNIIGSDVGALSWSHSETEWGCQPWSCRVSFVGNNFLIVCLGELNQDGLPEYMPDSLLITGSPRAAHAYRAVQGGESAWGDDEI